MSAVSAFSQMDGYMDYQNINVFSKFCIQSVFQKHDSYVV